MRISSRAPGTCSATARGVKLLAPRAIAEAVRELREDAGHDRLRDGRGAVPRRDEGLAPVVLDHVDDVPRYVLGPDDEPAQECAA